MDTSIRSFGTMLTQALERRRSLVRADEPRAFRVFSGRADGMDGVFVDVYGPGAVLIVYEGRAPRGLMAFSEAGPEGGEEIGAMVLERLSAIGVRGVYAKPFARDRSKLGGEAPEIVTRPEPLAGTVLPEFLLIRESGRALEVRLYDGWSTGLFLDQRANRDFIAQWVRDRGRRAGAVDVLNTFAYTCAFSVAAAMSGAQTASVDVSGRYLDWGKRNFAHNGLDPATHRFAKMDTFEFLKYAARKGLRFDAIVLDPPSFAAGSKKKGIAPWSAVSDYPRLIAAAVGLLKPGGMIFASTNTEELCRADKLDRVIAKGVSISSARLAPRRIALPEPPLDFARDQDRFTARAFVLA